MYLTKSFFALMAWMATSALGDYRWIESNGHIKLYRIPAGSIPVVGPLGIVGPNQFRNPTTTRRPFRRRPSTTKPQAFPMVVPSVTTRPMLVVGSPPPQPPETGSPHDEETLGVPGTYEGAPSFSNPGNNPGINSPDAEPVVPSQALPNNPPYLPQPTTTPEPENIATTPQPTTTEPVLPYKPPTSPEDPEARPPAVTISRPPIKPPVASQAEEPPKNPNAQPPFYSGPYVPPKPPPVPVTSASNFGVRPAPIGSINLPHRPIPPPRPIMHKPPPLPQPSFQLSTTEKPQLIYSESSFSENGNYNLDFQVSNSVYRREQGFLKKSLVKPWRLIHVKTGAYSFVSPEGTSHRVDFVADENGYRAFQSSS